MNARSCQLCGKPLSRLRVGGDGDFCSKEHRSQYNLRAGMDRLVEVNKVASLMRRRESAKQIPSAALIRNAALGRRGFMDSQPPRINPSPRLIPMRLAASTLTGIHGGGSQFIRHRLPLAEGMAQKSRTHATEVRFNVRETHLALPQRGLRQSFRLPQAGSTPLRSLAADHGRSHRDFTKLPPPPLRTHLGAGPDAFRKTRRMSVAMAERMRTFALPTVEGNALRVSIPVAFRVPATRTLARQAALAGQAGIQAAAMPRMLAGQQLTSSTTRRVAEIALPEVAVQLPSVPQISRSNGFETRGALRVNGKAFGDAAVQTHRPTEFQWNTNEPRFLANRLSHTPAGFARRNGTHLFKVSAKPNRVQSTQQLVSSPFVARDELCVPRVPYCNVLAAAAPTAVEAPAPAVTTPPPPQPVLVSAPVVVKHEEHFDAGWDNWVGGVTDWKVDVAGVRTGTLALFLPTLDMSDYDLEFLARIDTRTVTWVVRAEGRDTYLQCTLTAVEGGQVEFSRALVRGGAAEAPVISAERAPGKPRTAMTVRMSVAGPIFSVSVDGSTIDSWVDDRLATGGIGFMGAADDRARIYWVRVCSPAPSKEYTFQ